MACGDVLSLEDLQTAKKHQIFEAEVITGKAGGVAGGADIPTAVNAVTGQVQTTLPETLKALGFKHGSGDFTTGFTVTPGQRDYAWYDPISHNWYSYLGPIPSTGHIVAPGTNPVGDVNWKPATDELLRADLARQSGAGLIGGLPVFVTATAYAGGAATSSTNNDAAIIAAINDAIATGSFVYWPAVYEVQGNIPNFHSVRHDGPGGIKRGSDTFRVHALEWTQSTLYCSPTAAANGDGLTASNPMQWTKLRETLLNYTPLIGSWGVKLAAGTYTASSMVDVGDIMTASDFLKIMGPEASYGVPTAIIDGTGQSTQIGFRCGGRQKVWLRDVKFQHFNAPVSTAVAGIDFCELWADNVHVDDSSYVGLSVSHGRMRVTGGIYENCGDINLLAYNLTEYTVGYGGHGTICRNPKQYGTNFLVRDGSSGVILAGSQLTGSADGYGLSLVNFCRARLAGVTVTGNNIGVRAQFATFYDDGSNSISGNTKNFQLESCLDSNNSTHVLFDPITKNMSWGGGSLSSFRYYFKKATSGSGMSSSATFVVEDLSPLIGLMGDGKGLYGILVGKPGVGSQASYLYNGQDDTWRWRINNADTYRMASSVFQPMVDNTAALGSSAGRWSVVYAATGAINTSDSREKTDPLPIDDAVLDAWGDVQLITFQWLESIRIKGDAAREHFGVIAQQVRDAFIAHGLDGTNYGVLCYDEWGDIFEPVVEQYQEEVIVTNADGSLSTEMQTLSLETGEMRLSRPAGNRWGIRPDQCLFLEAAYQRRRCDRIEERLAALYAR